MTTGGQNQLERNRVVAALAWMALKSGWKVGVKRTDIEGWKPQWHGCVYIETPTGQVSWHFHDDHAYLFERLPEFDGEWDGHDTETKYERLRRLTEHPVPAASVVDARVVCPDCEAAVVLRRSADQIDFAVLIWYRRHAHWCPAG